MVSALAGPRRSRRLRLQRLSLLVVLLSFAAFPAWASDLWLPASAGETLRAALERDCPNCLERGLVACGAAEVQPGRRFARHFFQGTPRRGFLLTFAMSHATFRAALRGEDRESVVATLGARFEETRLVVVEDGFEAARVLPRAASVEVVYATVHHRCLGIERRTWSCCLGDGGADRTCLPKADAPHVVMTWKDAVTGEAIVATYTPVPGFSRLARSGPRGTTLYYCLSDEAGRIKAG